MSAVTLARLLPHPDTPCPVVRQLQVGVGGGQGTALVLTYELVGDLEAIRIPAPVAPAAADELWQHTCFEFFATRSGATDYREYNFSPSGQWAGYQFRAYRERDAGVLLPQPRTHLERRHDHLRLEVLLPPAGLPSSAAGQPIALQIGLSAVIEDRDGARSYWALHHPPGRPDFHHRATFALTLDFPA
jgi:hypothetical protein